MRRIADITDEPIVWASGNGGFWIHFTTTEHIHGLIDVTSLRVQWQGRHYGFGKIPDGESGVFSFASCRALFSGQQRMFSLRDCVFPDEQRRTDRLRFRRAVGPYATITTEQLVPGYKRMRVKSTFNPATHPAAIQPPPLVEWRYPR